MARLDLIISFCLTDFCDFLSLSGDAEGWRVGHEQKMGGDKTKRETF